VFDDGERRRRLGERMRGAGLDLLLLAPSADLPPDREPVFLLPRMAAVFELSREVPGS
jgi:hypothetical protein